MNNTKMLKKIIWIAIAAGAVCSIIALGAIFFRPYDTRELQGDATIDDTGLWSYPRYHVRFPAVSLSEPGEHIFTVRGLPPVSLTFILNLADLQEKEKGPRGETYERFKRIDTVVEFVWSCNGETVVSGVDPLKRWKLAWMPGNESGGYWHPNGRDVNFSRKKVYELKLKVSRVDVHAPPLLVVPTLEGGGNELP